jgi:DNA-binding response OmpR family regulator
LIVDDEEGIVFFMKQIYEKRGFTVFGATDGITAVELFKKEHPDISFIDIHMPYSPIDGIEVLRQIKLIDKNAYCVMLTRIDDKTSIVRCKELGALHYIPKPFETEDIDRCIDEVREKLKI